LPSLPRPSSNEKKNRSFVSGPKSSYAFFSPAPTITLSAIFAPPVKGPRLGTGETIWWEYKHQNTHRRRRTLGPISPHLVIVAAFRLGVGPPSVVVPPPRRRQPAPAAQNALPTLHRVPMRKPAVRGPRWSAAECGATRRSTVTSPAKELRPASSPQACCIDATSSQFRRRGFVAGGPLVSALQGQHLRAKPNRQRPTQSRPRHEGQARLGHAPERLRRPVCGVRRGPFKDFSPRPSRAGGCSAARGAGGRPKLKLVAFGRRRALSKGRASTFEHAQVFPFRKRPTHRPARLALALAGRPRSMPRRPLHPVGRVPRPSNQKGRDGRFSQPGGRS